MVLGLHIDRREHAVGAHAAQQVDRADTGAGPDLDHSAGGRGGGQHTQRCPGPREHGYAAELGGFRPSGREHLVLGDEVLGIGPAGLQVPADDCLPVQICAQRRVPEQVES
jgi:hypothetical protein